MLKIYGTSLSPPVIRVRLCINALGLEHEYIPVAPGPDTQTEQYLAMHPAGKVPVIDDNGFTMFESTAIIKYLCRQHRSGYYPEELIQQAIVDQWADFIAIHIGGGVGRILFNKVFADLFGREKDPRSMQDGYDFLKRYLPIIENRLSMSEYLVADNLSIVDFSLLAAIDPAEVIELNIADYPRVKEWRDKLKQQSFYRQIHTSYEATLEQIKKMLA